MYQPGLKGIVAAQTAISHIDGEKGILYIEDMMYGLLRENVHLNKQRFFSGMVDSLPKKKANIWWRS